MARKASEAVLPQIAEPAPELVRNDLNTIDNLAAATSEQNMMVRAVAHQVGYQLPADCTDPDLIQRDIASNMRRTVEAMIEVGRGLIVLREACAHGEFMARLDVLGFDSRAAQRYMQVVRKFANASTSTHLLKAAATQSKLLEMLVLDDEQIEELELTGQTGELNLDDIATMSVKELREALRDAREQGSAKDRLLADKNAKIDELSTGTKRHKPVVTEVDEKVGAFKAEIAAGFDALETTISQMYLVHGAILKEDVQWGDTDDAERLILRQFATLFGDRLNRSAQQLAELCDHYEATLAGWRAELDGHALQVGVAADNAEA
ncbi:DUF3102 domain-containing protein [Parazoarcus communis]|uniref:DUF3102 domain-containing protein n=1 Tax=Parazoarcus communis TaxID=41977 RepID=UPI000D58F572|nr:DUF3102 domain-containing protein [Parazoarcus communis]